MCPRLRVTDRLFWQCRRLTSLRISPSKSLARKQREELAGEKVFRAGIMAPMLPPTPPMQGREGMSWRGIEIKGYFLPAFNFSPLRERERARAAWISGIGYFAVGSGVKLQFLPTGKKKSLLPIAGTTSSHPTNEIKFLIIYGLGL